MKSTLITILLLNIMAVSYSHETDFSKNIPGLKSGVFDDTCYSTNYSVYPQGVLFWQASWFAYYGITPNMQVNNCRTFSNANMQLLKTKYPDLTGYRVYYGMISMTDTIPLLIMVAVDSNCNDMYNSNSSKSVIVSDSQSDYFVTDSLAGVYTSNWRAYSQAHPELIKTQIYAYNYDAEIIERLLSKDGQPGDLLFEFGLRTISPQEVYFQIEDELIHGSIVYCNLVHGTAYASNDGLGRYDFAKPCPYYCDQAHSPLIE